MTNFSIWIYFEMQFISVKQLKFETINFFL